MGTWYDVAVATTCARMQNQRSDAAIGKLVLQSGDTEGKLKAIRTHSRSVRSPCIMHYTLHILKTNAVIHKKVSKRMFLEVENNFFRYFKQIITKDKYFNAI